MNRYYTRTFIGLGAVLFTLLAAAFLGNSIAGEARKHYRDVVEAAKVVGDHATAQRERVNRFRMAMGPVREFSAAWKPFARLSEKDAADRVRSDMETIAQRQLALVTDNAITPQPDRLANSLGAFRVQRVTLRASGKDLAALLTWLGKVEETHPAALVESCEFTSNVGGSTGLTVRVVQPLIETGAFRPIGALDLQDIAKFPEIISSVLWKKYLPMRVKSAVAVGLQRNPLQPAVVADQRPMSVLRDEADEISPRVERALEGRVRSVIRGTSPIVVIDGRVFRIGDEVVIGKHREKVVAAVKTRLKHIGDDHLLLQVSGGTTERPIICDVAYELPAFLKAR